MASWSVNADFENVSLTMQRHDEILDRYHKVWLNLWACCAMVICQLWGDFWILWGDFIFRVAPCSGIFAIGPQRIAQISRGYKVNKIVGVVCLAKKLQKMLDFCTCPCSISSFLFFQPKARNSFLSHPKVWELTTKASLPVVSLPAMCWAQS
jgi:hypothetical protein